jgi:hypothetical protein
MQWRPLVLDRRLGFIGIIVLAEIGDGDIGAFAREEHATARPMLESAPVIRATFAFSLDDGRPLAFPGERPKAPAQPHLRFPGNVARRPRCGERSTFGTMRSKITSDQSRPNRTFGNRECSG